MTTSGNGRCLRLPLDLNFPKVILSGFNTRPSKTQENHLPFCRNTATLKFKWKAEELEQLVFNYFSD